MRVSYLRYVLKTAADPVALIDRESEQLPLTPRFKALLAAFLPNSEKASREAVTA
jgi:hypothetical protein